MTNMRKHRWPDGKRTRISRTRTLPNMKGTHMSTVSLRSSHANLAGLGGARPPARSTWQTRLTGVVDVMLTWHERARERRQLLSLSDHMLHDLGIGRAEVEAEASKPFWRP